MSKVSQMVPDLSPLQQRVLACFTGIGDSEADPSPLGTLIRGKLLDMGLLKKDAADHTVATRLGFTTSRFYEIRNRETNDA